MTIVQITTIKIERDTAKKREEGTIRVKTRDNMRNNYK